MNDSLGSRYNNHLAPSKQPLEEFKNFHLQKRTQKQKRKLCIIMLKS